jgi:hydroxymethylbilane synthase
MQTLTLRIATRTSPLALWQAGHVADLLKALHDQPKITLVPVVTSGDQNQTESLSQFRGTGVFTREVQSAVLEERADIAVHSLKDLPTESAPGLMLAAVPARASRFDALLLPAGAAEIPSVQDLPRNARIGTGSPRRQAQLLSMRPDLQVQEIRGNLDTRLRKLDEGQYDAIVLAVAGLARLNLLHRVSLILQPPEFFPAVSQGALGIECRAADPVTRTLLHRLNCTATLSEVIAERSLLRTLRAGCHAPLGVQSTITDTTLTLTGILLSPDGTSRLEQSSSGSVGHAEAVGIAVADQLLASGADRILGPRSV